MRTTLPWTCAVLLGAIGWLLGYFMGDSVDGRAGAAPLAAGTTNIAAASSTGGALIGRPDGVFAGKDFESAAATILEDRNQMRQAARLYQMVEGLSAAEIPAALNAAMHLEPNKRMALVNGLILRWVELDPQAAVQYASQLPRDPKYLYVQTTALGSWAEKDFTAASQYVLALPPGKDRDVSIGGLATGLASTDPQRALALLAEHLPANSGDGLDFASNVIQQWAQKDFEGAMSYALGIKDRDRRRNTLVQMAYGESNKAPQDLVNWAKDLPDREARNAVAETALRRWSARDPQAVLAYARTLPPGSVAESAFSSAIAHLAERDPAEARRIVEQMPETAVRTRALQSFISAWAHQDVASATEYVKGLPEGSARMQALGTLAQQVTQKDPEAALAIIELLPDGNARRSGLQQISWQWGRSDPKAAAEYFLENPLPGEEGNYLLSNVLNNWSNNAPDEVLEWAAKLPEGRERSRAISSALGQIAGSDPESAATAALKQSGEAQASSVTAVTARWAQHDPASASAWVAKLPESDARNNAFTSLIYQWAEADAAKAAKWLEDLPEGKSRDSAVRTFSERVTARDPEGAIQWAGTISDEGTRRSAIENITRNWMRRDSTAATAWVQSSKLFSAEERARVLSFQQKK